MVLLISYSSLFDEVYVRTSPGYVEQQHVKVEGEVQFQGTYVITKKKYRLTDLIAAAGGLTKEAYAKGARLETSNSLMSKNSSNKS